MLRYLCTVRCLFFSQATFYEIFKKLDPPSAADALSVTTAKWDEVYCRYQDEDLSHQLVMFCFWVILHTVCQ